MKAASDGVRIDKFSSSPRSIALNTASGRVTSIQIAPGGAYRARVAVPLLGVRPRARQGRDQSPSTEQSDRERRPWRPGSQAALSKARRLRKVPAPVAEGGPGGAALGYSADSITQDHQPKAAAQYPADACQFGCDRARIVARFQG